MLQWANRKMMIQFTQHKQFVLKSEVVKTFFRTFALLHMQDSLHARVAQGKSSGADAAMFKFTFGLQILLFMLIYGYGQCLDKNLQEEVHLFDWELLQQELEDFIQNNETNCKRDFSFCFENEDKQ